MPSLNGGLDTEAIGGRVFKVHFQKKKRKLQKRRKEKQRSALIDALCHTQF